MDKNKYSNKITIKTIKSEPTPIIDDKFIQIPIFNSISDSIAMPQNIEGYHSFPKEFFSKNKDYFCVKTDDNSMNNLFISDDLIVIEKKSYFENGDIVAVSIENIGTTIRKIAQNKSLVTLIPCSSNADYISHTYDLLEVKIVGKIIGSMRRY